MAIIPIFNSIRLIPRDSAFLDRRLGSRGEIVFDSSSNSLRVYNSTQQGGFKLARADLSNISNSDFLSKASAAGVGGAGVNSFSTISVAGQSNVLADAANDSLTLIAGSNITITTNSSTDSITISATVPEGGGASNSFETIAVAGQSDIVANSDTDTLTLAAGTGITIATDPDTDTITITNSAPVGNSFANIDVAGQSTISADAVSDTLTFVAGSGISLTTNASTDSITITSTVPAGVTTFTNLTDINSTALTVDKIYLPAITMLTVTNSGASAYRFDQYGTTNNPTIYAINGTTIAFNLSASGHPFLIQNGAGTNYNTGLIHVSTTGVVSTGSDAQGKDSGTLYWKIPESISGGYRYQCQAHAPMVGSISIKNFGSI